MKKVIAFTFMVTLFIGCSDSFLNINDNPNNPKDASLRLILPSAQISMAANMTTGFDYTSAVLARQWYDLGISTFALNTTSFEFQGVWDGMYSGALKDFQLIIDQGTSTQDWGYVGISRICKSYLFQQLVDVYGDVPYFDALQGENVTAPEFDDAELIYRDLLKQLDTAIVELKRPFNPVANDLIYGGTAASWIRAANTLKLKLWVNLSMVEPTEAVVEINKLLADPGGLILAFANDMQFRWGTAQVPQNRHPLYRGEYINGADTYHDHHFMHNMVVKNDPRIRYYYYKQSKNSGLTFDTTPCSGRTDCVWWPVLSALPAGDGYIGRDFGDPSGLPADQNLRTNFGIYPIGGSFDNNTFLARNANTTGRNGMLGAGLTLFLTSFNTNFWLAEVKNRLAGINGLTEREYFQNAMTQSFNKIRAFATGSVESANITAWETANSYVFNTQRDNYINDRLDEYDDAANPANRLRTIMTEKYVATFGMGADAWSDIRRTNYPSNLQAPLKPSGPEPNRYLYPNTELATNINAPTTLPVISTPVFWDVN